MRKCVYSAVILGVGATGVHAQSSVTIYGLMDAGIRVTNNVGGSSKTEQNYGTPPRLGFRGREDLGDGLSASFVLEMGFNSDTGTLGQGGRAFGRQSLIGISQRGWGTIQFGRGYDAMVDYLQPLTAGGQTWAGGLGSHWGDIDNVNNYFRVQNAVKYISDDLNGFKFGGHYSLGEGTDDHSKNSSYSVGASYASGPIKVAAAYMNVDSPITAVFDGNNNGSFQAGSPYIGIQTADKLKTYGLGGTYSFEWQKARVGALYTNTKLVNSALARGDASYENFEINAQFDATPSVQLGAAYNYTLGDLAATGLTPKFHQFNVGAVYRFSKTTSLYAQVAYQRAAGDARFAEINLLPASSGKSQTVTQLALRVIF
jgi:GBP family porin